jgi:hypothetical protein
MKSTRRYSVICALAMVGFLFMAVPRALAQHDGDQDADDLINPPPCDFSDTFYGENGVDTGHGALLFSPGAGRFGTFRQFGPPATKPGQANWVADSHCGQRDPTRRNFRILATTGAYKDDDGAPTEFFSIMAFVRNQTFFTGATNVRGFQAVDIISNFEAYAANRQRLSNGTLAPTPCGSLADPNVLATDCFSVVSVATPDIRQDWRVASNRNAIDGSDNNCPSSDTSICAAVHNSPFGYFCDDLLGAWILTYFWYTQFAVGGTDTNGHPFVRTANCNKVLAAVAANNGTTLDGTPIVHTGNELNFMEGRVGVPPPPGLTVADLPPPDAPCAAEGNLDPAGSDGGAIWLICPVIPDPRDGAIAADAFLDTVRRNGGPLDKRFNINFNCLKFDGQFPDGQNGCQNNLQFASTF